LVSSLLHIFPEIQIKGRIDVFDHNVILDCGVTRWCGEKEMKPEKTSGGRRPKIWKKVPDSSGNFHKFTQFFIICFSSINNQHR
jgi:hypothetical protein